MKHNRTKITLSNEHESYRPTQTPPPAPVVVLLGRRCQQTTMTFSALIRRGIRVTAVVLSTKKSWASPLRRIDSDTSHTRIPMIGMTGNDTIERLARDNGTRVYELTDVGHPVVQETFAHFQPDLIVTSCFPQLVPATLLATARHGGLNLHPSLLPQYRGPDPLFWIYRDSVLRTGVSVHQLGGRFDSGDIVLQEAFDVPVGLPGNTLDRQCAEIGGRLLARAISQVAQGTAALFPQDERYATYQTWPSEQNLLVLHEWPAQRSWHFVRGVVPLGYQPLIEIGRERLAICRAIEYRHDQRSDLGIQRTGNQVAITTLDGTVTFQIFS